MGITCTAYTRYVVHGMKPLTQDNITMHAAQRRLHGCSARDVHETQLSKGIEETDVGEICALSQCLYLSADVPQDLGQMYLHLQ